jgi:hypothetical protein
MNQDLIDALAPQRETVEIGGKKFVVKEVEFATDVVSLLAEADGPLRLLTACVECEDGTPAFTIDDVPVLRTRALLKVQTLLKAAYRVNGISTEATEKK